MNTAIKVFFKQVNSDREVLGRHLTAKVEKVLGICYGDMSKAKRGTQ